MGIRRAWDSEIASSILAFAIMAKEMINYRGWEIYWTGWKEDWSTAVGDVDQRDPESRRCPICGVGVIAGDRIKLDWTTDRLTHWLCEYPDGRQGWLWSQWIAARHPAQRDEKFVYVNCSNMPTEKQSGGRFKRGSAFEVPEGYVPVTEHSSEQEKESARANGLARLFQLLDLEADGELENPVRFCYCTQCVADVE